MKEIPAPPAQNGILKVTQGRDLRPFRDKDRGRDVLSAGTGGKTDPWASYKDVD